MNHSDRHSRAGAPALVALVVILALTLTSCGGSIGGSPKIEQVRSCLSRLKLDVEGPKGADAARIESGVSATGGLDPASELPLTIVVAAYVKRDEHVSQFTKEAQAFKQELGPERQREFTVHDGYAKRYVWVVAGDETSSVFRAAERCVKP